MTRQEAIQILSLLKAAYPNSYKGMTKDEANGTINVWAVQFGIIPYSVVSIAINKLISTNTFPPSIGEVKEKIRGLYWEAWGMLNEHKSGLLTLDSKTLATLDDIINVCEPMRTQSKIEPSLGDLLTGYNAYLQDGDNAEKRQIGGGNNVE